MKRLRRAHFLVFFAFGVASTAWPSSAHAVTPDEILSPKTLHWSKPARLEFHKDRPAELHWDGQTFTIENLRVQLVSKRTLLPQAIGSDKIPYDVIMDSNGKTTDTTMDQHRVMMAGLSVMRLFPTLITEKQMHFFAILPNDGSDSDSTIDLRLVKTNDSWTANNVERSGDFHSRHSFDGISLVSIASWPLPDSPGDVSFLTMYYLAQQNQLAYDFALYKASPGNAVISLDNSSRHGIEHLLLPASFAFHPFQAGDNFTFTATFSPVLKATPYYLFKDVRFQSKDGREYAFTARYANGAGTVDAFQMAVSNKNLAQDLPYWELGPQNTAAFLSVLKTGLKELPLEKNELTPLFADAVAWVQKPAAFAFSKDDGKTIRSIDPAHHDGVDPNFATLGSRYGNPAIKAANDFQAKGGQSRLLPEGLEKVVQALDIVLPDEMLAATPALPAQVAEGLLQENPVGQNMAYLKLPDKLQKDVVETGQNGALQLSHMFKQWGENFDSATADTPYLFIIDLSRPYQKISEDQRAYLSTLLQMFNSVIRTGSLPYVRFIFLLSESQRDSIRNPSDQSVDFSLWERLPTERKIKILHEEVERRLGASMPLDLFRQILNKISARLAKPEEQLYWDINGVSDKLRAAIGPALARDLQGPDLVRETVNLAAHLFGARIVPTFTPAHLTRVYGLTEKVLTQEKDPTIDDPILGIEDQVFQLEQRLDYAVNGGFQDTSTIVATLMGESGTGKTMLANYIAKTVGAAYEIIDLKAPTAMPLRTDLQNQVQSAVTKLHEKHDPLKILILDELDKNPNALKLLASAFGDQDALSENVLNLSGLVVIPILNVDMESQEYRSLLDAHASGVSTQPYVTAVVKKSLHVGDGPESATQRRLVDALVRRISSSVIPFYPVRNDAKLQKKLMRSVLRKFERELGVQLILPERVEKNLLQITLENSDGNFRSIKRKLPEYLRTAHAAYLRRYGAKAPLKSSQYYTIAMETGSGGQTSFMLEPLRFDNQEGVQTLVRDTLMRELQSLSQELQTRAEQFQEASRSTDDKLHRNLYDSNTTMYASMHAALEQVIQKLADNQEPTPSYELPPENPLRALAQNTLERPFATQIQALFHFDAGWNSVSDAAVQSPSAMADALDRAALFLVKSQPPHHYSVDTVAYAAVALAAHAFIQTAHHTAQRLYENARNNSQTEWVRPSSAPATLSSEALRCREILKTRASAAEDMDAVLLLK